MENYSPVINLKDTFQTIDRLATADSHYSVDLRTYIPNEKDPYSTFSFIKKMTLGHSSVSISFQRGEKKRWISFGFYPRLIPLPWFLLAPIPSVIRENTEAATSATFSMQVSFQQYLLLRQTALELSRQPYHFQTNNCTDFTVNLFSSISSSPIVLKPHTIHLPHRVIAYMTKVSVQKIVVNQTPQGLFQAIQVMNGPK
ncbi:MAG: hypothetical protein P4L51_01795 [Puia sp.]|nr:hypothetical protein [Puia sp.]